MSNKYRSTTFSLQSLSLLGIQSAVYCEFSSLDYNSEMQLCVGGAHQIGDGFSFQ